MITRSQLALLHPKIRPPHWDIVCVFFYISGKVPDRLQAYQGHIPRSRVIEKVASVQGPEIPRSCPWAVKQCSEAVQRNVKVINFHHILISILRKVTHMKFPYASLQQRLQKPRLIGLLRNLQKIVDSVWEP